MEFQNPSHLKGCCKYLTVALGVVALTRNQFDLMVENQVPLVEGLVSKNQRGSLNRILGQDVRIHHKE